MSKQDFPKGAVHTRDSIRYLLQTNDRAVERALVALYRRQTALEQHSRETLTDNGQGFNAADARILTIYAQGLLDGQTLQAHELKFARERLVKYAGQLLEIAVSKQFGL
jgi:hypothetical protein